MTKVASCVAWVLASGVLGGCFPYVMSYVYLDAPGVAFKRSPCYDGAPVGVVYERGGVRFEVSLEPHALSRLNEAYLKLRAPRGAGVSIPDPVARFVFQGTGNATLVPLKAAPLDWQGPYIEEARRKSPLAEYRFVFAGLPPIQSAGTLHLPVVVVDGVSVDSPIFTFERRPYAGIVPLNC